MTGADCNPKTPGVGALVPVKFDVPDPNLFATFGFGREVSRSDCMKAEDRSARDFVGSSLVLLVAEAPVAAGDSCRTPSSDGFWALARDRKSVV